VDRTQNPEKFTDFSGEHESLHFSGEMRKTGCKQGGGKRNKTRQKLVSFLTDALEAN
jgi:hypothetical protein